MSPSCMWSKQLTPRQRRVKSSPASNTQQTPQSPRSPAPQALCLYLCDLFHARQQRSILYNIYILLLLRLWNKTTGVEVRRLGGVKIRLAVRGVLSGPSFLWPFLFLLPFIVCSVPKMRHGSLYCYFASASQ